MPFRPSRFLPSRRERRIRKLYSASDDADKLMFIKTVMRERPTTHVGNFAVIDAQDEPKIAKRIVFHVPTGKFRTDDRPMDKVVEWITQNEVALNLAFNKRK